MALDPFDWTCPHCNRPQTVTENNYHRSFSKLHVGETVHGELGLSWTAIRCMNPQCKELTLDAIVTPAEWKGNNWVLKSPAIDRWRLRPSSAAKPQPAYIPAALREDYLEACLIKDLSPKASATLSRRCLQGMIRDFCGIAKGSLNEEISTLRKLVEADNAPKGVEAETMEAIDAVREIGNIGAHMEKDIGLIVEVEPNEAQALIELIEMLFEEWYVARHERQLKLERVKAIAGDKKAVKAAHKTKGAIPVPEEVSPEPDEQQAE